jgi:pyruvate ferredoxin oxidoreductase beta subunit
MAVNLKKFSEKDIPFTGGHRLCAGCGVATIIRQVLIAIDFPIVVANATGCLEVASTIFPYTSWKVPYIHSAFANAAATISGIEVVYKALKEEGLVDKEIRFLAIGGDGGTYDIGLQALSGALERGHRFVYLCYDNEAYMNTGMQRSSASVYGSWTTTTPIGEKIKGKMRPKKPLTEIVAAHGIPYVAQASPSHWRDFMVKVQKAFEVDGPAFLNVIQPCIPGWRIDPFEAIELARLAVETAYWPLYEVVAGSYRITVRLKEKKPVIEWLKRQGRFRHLLKPENEQIVREIQTKVDQRWEWLIKVSETKFS